MRTITSMKSRQSSFTFVEFLKIIEKNCINSVEIQSTRANANFLETATKHDKEPIINDNSRIYKILSSKGEKRRATILIHRGTTVTPMPSRGRLSDETTIPDVYIHESLTSRSSRLDMKNNDNSKKEIYQRSRWRRRRRRRNNFYSRGSPPLMKILRGGGAASRAKLAEVWVTGASSWEIVQNRFIAIKS